MSISFCRLAISSYILAFSSAVRWSGLYSTSILESSIAFSFSCSIMLISDFSVSTSA